MGTNMEVFMDDNLKRALWVVGGAVVGSLVTWVLINWMPNTTIIAGALACSYIAFKKSEEL